MPSHSLLCRAIIFDFPGGSYSEEVKVWTRQDQTVALHASRTMTNSRVMPRVPTESHHVVTTAETQELHFRSARLNGDLLRDLACEDGLALRQP